MPFDPTQPFTPGADAAKPAFDPTKPFQAAQDAPGSTTGGSPRLPPEVTAIHMPGDYEDAANPYPGFDQRDPKAVAEAVQNAPAAFKMLGGVLASGAAGPIAAAAGAGPWAATGIDALAGGAAGAIQHGGLSGFLTGAALQGGMGGAMRAAAPLLQKGGQVLSGLPAEQAGAYAENPAAAEALANQNKTDPLALHQSLQAQGKTAMQRLRGLITGNQGDVVRAGAGKTFQVNPSQFEGTAASPEIQRSWDLQGQTAPGPKDPFTGQPGAPSPAPLPDRTQLSVSQLLRAKAAAGQAAGIAYRPNQAALSPADSAAAEANSQAAVNLGKALKAGVPGAEDSLNEMHEQLRMKEAFERTDPSKLLTNTDSTGSIPNRSMRQYLDENTGSNFQQQANQLSAAQALNPRFNALKGAPGTIEQARMFGAKALLKSKAALSGAPTPNLNSILNGNGNGNGQ